MIYKDGEQIAVSGDELEALKQQLMNELQNKYITWKGETLLVTTVLQRIFETANGKINLVLADNLPATTEPNTQYWIKTYDGTTLTNGRYIIVTDSLNVAEFVGTTEIDISKLYQIPETDYILASGDTITIQALKDLITAGQPIKINSKIAFFSTETTTDYQYTCLSENATTNLNNLNLIKINKSTWVITFKSVDIAGNSLADLITEDEPYDDKPLDTNTLSNLDIETAKLKKITFGNFFKWVKSKLIGAISTVLTDNLTADRVVITNSSGKLEVAGAVTANTTNGWKTFAVDKYGRVYAYTAKSLDSNVFVDSSNVISLKDLITAVTTNDRMYPIKVDAKGRVTALGTGHAVSAEYKSAANNQLFLRNGANALWKQATHLVGIFARTSSQTFTINAWSNISLNGSNDVDSSYAQLASSGIKILKTGIYNFQMTVRLTDSISSETFIEWAIGLTGHDDDASGGVWACTKHRHKVNASVYAYVTANSIVYPRIYSTGGINTINYCNVMVQCIKES